MFLICILFLLPAFASAVINGVNISSIYMYTQSGEIITQTKRTYREQHNITLEIPFSFCICLYVGVPLPPGGLQI